MSEEDVVQGRERLDVIEHKPLSAVMQRARDWLSFSSPRQPGWALVRDLAAENDALTMENDSLRDAREELAVSQARYEALAQKHLHLNEYASDLEHRLADCQRGRKAAQDAAFRRGDALREIAEFDIGARLAPVAACKEIAADALQPFEPEDRHTNLGDGGAW